MIGALMMHHDFAVMHHFRVMMHHGWSSESVWNYMKRSYVSKIFMKELKLGK